MLLTWPMLRIVLLAGAAIFASGYAALRTLGPRPAPPPALPPPPVVDAGLFHEIPAPDLEAPAP